MFGLDPVIIALIFIGLGGSLAVLVQLILRSSRKPVRQTPAPEPAEAMADPNNAGGVLVVSPGGRILSANQTIRTWLNLSDEALPNLEQIARRANPADSLLELCAEPSTKRLSLQGLLVDAASYRFPGIEGDRMLVTLQRVDISPLRRDAAGGSSALNILSELGILMTTNADLPMTIHAILESVERLIPADIAEITVWHPEEYQLVPYRLVGLPGIDRKLDMPATRYKPGIGYTGKLFQTLEPLVVNQADRALDANQGDHKTYPFKSYLGVPLMTGEVPIGTLELGSLTDIAYTEKDLETLKLLSNQAAVALRHALTRQEEEKRVAELTGLANLVQAVGSLNDPRDLFTHLIHSIQPLADVEMLGFLLFDDNARMLQAQVPFLGIPDHFVRLYHADIRNHTPGEDIWLSQEMIVAPDAEHDKKLEALGLSPLVQASGIRNTVLIPLSTRTGSIGYLQAANKRSGAPFTQDELRILSIVAGQSAVILENASLLEKSRRRTVQAEALRRISALAGSAVTLDEILLFTLNEIVRLLQVDHAAIYLLDHETTELAVHLGSAYGLNAGRIESFRAIRVDDPLFARSNTVQQRVSVFNRHTPAIENEPFYQRIFEAFDSETLLSVPLTVSDRSVGELILGSHRPDFFHQAEVGITSTAAGQLAGAIERVMLSSRTDEQLQRRVVALSMLNRIYRELTSAETPGDLIEAIHREALQVTSAECATVYSIEFRESTPVILDSFGEHAAPDVTLSGLDESGLGSEKPSVITDFSAFGSAPHGGVASVLLVPLQIEDEKIGLLSLHSYDPNAFPDETVELAEAFALQAALNLKNMARLQESHAAKQGALTSEKESAERSDRPLSNRAQAYIEIVRAVSRQTTREDIFTALNDAMLQRLGFDAGLIAIPSAKGAILAHVTGQLPPEVKPDVLMGQRNPLRQTLASGEAYFHPTPASNGEAGWTHSPLIQHLQARSYACIPIPALDSENEIAAAFLGISGDELPAFTPADQELFNLLSRQVSASLQNAALLAESKDRLREVDLLLNFSSRLRSFDADEILNALLENARSIVPHAQAAQILLWNEASEHLSAFKVTGYRKNEVMAGMHWMPGEGLPGLVFADGKTRRIAEVNIARDYNLPYEKLLLYQDATQGVVPIASLVVPIVSGTSTSGVFILDNFSSPGAFTDDDEGLIGSLARQTGLILENARLLEEANARAKQLEALADVSQTITTDLQVDPITNSMLDNLQRVLPFDTGTLWLRQGEVLAIRATLGFEGEEDRVGLKVHIRDSKLLSDMVAESRPINVKNVLSDPRFVLPSDFASLSWLGIPLIAKGQVVGVVALEKAEEAFYSLEHIQIATAFAGQAAVALENARLFEESIQRAFELNERSQRLDILNRISNEFSVSLDLEHILAFTVAEVRKAVSSAAVSAVLVDEDGNGLLTAQSPAVISPLPQPFDLTPFDHLRESLGVLIVDNVYIDPELQLLEDYWKAMGTQTALVLSIATGNDLHGLIVLHNHTRLNSSEVDLARTISNQVAVAVQNAKLFEQLRNLTEELEARVNLRTLELEREHTRAETLLGIITELSASLDMDIVLNRTLALINRISGAEHSTIILSNPADASLLRRASQGYALPAREGGDMTDLQMNEGLAGWVIDQREAALIDDVRYDPRWVFRGDTEHRSAIAIPLMLGAEALGALILYHREIGHFSTEQLDLISAAAKQIAVAVNNAHLYLLIRDQAERLGGMLRSQQIEASQLRAILEAVADGVLVTNARGQISIFNHSAEDVLELEPDAVLNKSLDYFTGLFGKAGQKWMETIRAWSAEPYNFHVSETFFEQIELENKRIVAVNLAPVYSSREFMGTVSIFRDITHLIEVDRMKSEFVATVSHELRTPMTSIKGYVDILLMGAAGELNPQQQNFLNVVQENTERLNILVNDLLEVSRIEAGKVNLNLAGLDLAALATDVATDFRIRSREEGKSLKITVEAPKGLPLALGDVDRVRQILTNLMANAYNYTPMGGRITVSFVSTPDFIRVAMKDTGVGIPPEEHDRVFERFYRGEAPLVTAVAGTGLGLSIVKYFVTLHGGEIWVDSKGLPGEGTTFFFTLPTQKQEESRGITPAR